MFINVDGLTIIAGGKMITVRNFLAYAAILITLVAAIAVYALYMQSPSQTQPTIGDKTSEDSMPKNVSQEPVSSQFNETSQESSNVTHKTPVTGWAAPILPEIITVPEIINFTDATGSVVTIKTPVKSIISLNPGLTEVICALGGEGLIIGRDENSIFPKSVLNKPVVAANSYRPNLELIIEKNPDILVADTMLSYNKDALKALKEAGITVIIELSNNSTRIKNFVYYMGLALGNPERARVILDYINRYETLVLTRVGSLREDQKPRVYIEWHSAWRSFGPGSASHQNIIAAGGLNIAAESTTASPTLSPEYVVERNPHVILVMVPAEQKGKLDGFIATRNEILSRPELAYTAAVKEGRVYVYDSVITQGLRYPVGLLYWAKWFHPALFNDVDPGRVHAELIRMLFGETLEGVYVYP